MSGVGPFASILHVRARSAFTSIAAQQWTSRIGRFVPTTAVSGCNNGCTRRASYSITSSARASSVELISPPASSLSRDEYIAGTGVAP